MQDLPAYHALKEVFFPVVCSPQSSEVVGVGWTPRCRHTLLVLLVGGAGRSHLRPFGPFRMLTSLSFPPKTHSTSSRPSARTWASLIP